MVSWATMLAMERGNTDLLMFATAVLFAHVAMRSAPSRCAGYVLVLGAGLLKFYPLVMLALVIREPRPRVWMVGGLCALVLTAFLARFDAELWRIGANMANSPFGDMYVRVKPVVRTSMRDAVRDQLLAWIIHVVLSRLGTPLSGTMLGATIKHFRR